MGNSHSIDDSRPAVPSQAYTLLTRRVEAAFEAYELKSIRSTFEKLATLVGDELVWTQDTFVKFLELPDSVGPTIFLSASYCASYPLTNYVPMLLTYGALVRVLALMTDRTEGVLRRTTRLHLLFNSFASVQDRSQNPSKPSEPTKEEQAFAELDTEETMDTLLIRKADFKVLLQFLFSIQEKRNVQVVSHYIDRFTGEVAQKFTVMTEAVVDTISTAETITFRQVERFMQRSPDLFFALQSLYSRLIYATTDVPQAGSQPKRAIDSSNLLNDSAAAQLSLFIPRDLIFGSLDKLYIASRDGFSMGSLETKVCRYPGPTVTIVHGFSNVGETKVGFFCLSPWVQSAKHTFGDADTILFELLPHHRVYKAPALRHGALFAKSIGVGVGYKAPPFNSKHLDYEELSLFIDTSLDTASFKSGDDTTNIQIRDMEVWGLGGDKEAQRKAWDWEEAEATRRRNVNISDLKGDYDLLEMAGLVGQNRSGGSI